MSGAGHSVRSRPERNYALDTAKGIGIILVVFGHAWRGAFDAGILTDAGLFHVIDNMIYAFHMPLFFFLSGLLFLDFLKKTKSGRFVQGRIRRLLWPFALWTWIFFGMKLVAGGAANRPVTLADFPVLPLPPYEHLWFLWALFLAQLLVFGLYLLLKRSLDTTKLRVFFGIIAVALCLVIPVFYVPSPLFGAAVEHLPYFLMGIALGGVANLRFPAWASVLAAAAFALLIYGTADNWASLLVSMVLCILFCIVITAMDGSERQTIAPFMVLRRLGTLSLAIFLAHTIFSAAFRIVMIKIGILSLPLHLVVATVVGILGPILLVRMADKLSIRGWLGI